MSHRTGKAPAPGHGQLRLPGLDFTQPVIPGVTHYAERLAACYRPMIKTGGAR